MSCKRVFSNNKDVSYNNYYDKKKFIIKNGINSYIYRKRDEYIKSDDNFDVPINIIEGATSFYTNINDLSNNNCTECVNSLNLCEGNSCNKMNFLYPHGMYIKKKYDRCQNIPNIFRYNSLTHNLDNIYENNKFKNSVVTNLNSYYNSYMPSDDYNYAYYNGYYNGHNNLP